MLFPDVSVGKDDGEVGQGELRSAHLQSKLVCFSTCSLPMSASRWQTFAGNWIFRNQCVGKAALCGVIGLRIGCIYNLFETLSFINTCVEFW